MSVASFSETVHASTLNAETLLHERLADAYAAALKAVAPTAAARFEREAHALAAAAPNREFVVAATPDDLVPKDELAAEIEKRTRDIREMVVAATVAGVLTEAGLSFTVGGIFSRRILDQVGARIPDAEKSTRDAIRTVIDRAQSEGWTVPETAGAIRQHIVALAPSTATQLARTDLIGTANASSIAAARMVFAGQGTITKSWLATEDERTRPTHAEADGQVVPLDGQFRVGTSLMDYPGDPSAPDGEVCNCRCTLTFAEGGSLTASVWEAIGRVFRHP